MHQQDAESDDTMAAAAAVSADAGVNDLAAQGNLLKGIVIWLVSARSVVQRPLSPLDNKFLVTIFLYFNLKQKLLFTNSVGHTYRTLATITRS